VWGKAGSFAYPPQGGLYPWDIEPLFTDAWIADRAYLNSGVTPTTIAPEKGIISGTITAGGYSALWGSKNRGMVTLVGATSHISLPGLAAKVAGNPAHEFTLIQSFDILVGGVVNGKSAWAFTGTSSTAKLVEANVKFTSHEWQTNQFDDAGHSNVSTSTTVVTTGRLVLSTAYKGSNARSTLYINTTPLSMGHANTSMGQTTLTKFTIAAFDGATLLNVMPMNWRATIFSPFEMATKYIYPVASYLANE